MSKRRAGTDALAAAFAQAQAEGRTALLTYLTAGYPSLTTSEDLVLAVERAGADIVELGVPFSDPIADGPVIQRASFAALAQGVTPRAALALAGRLRQAALAVPLVFMGYYNPILAYGPAAYAQACREVGVDGLIVPDLPLEEAGELEAACRAKGLALVYLVAPSTPEPRLSTIAAHAQGFLYLVSRPGVTGARAGLPEGLAEYVARVRRHAPLPLALGFGISRPEQVRQLAGLVDGVVVGSAIVERAREGVEVVEGFVRELRA